MARYSFDKKMEIVQAYLNQEGSYETLAKRFGVTDYSMVRRWMKQYQELGADGLLRSREHQNILSNSRFAW